VQREQEASVRLPAALGFDLAWNGPGGGTPLHLAGPVDGEAAVSLR
jgi:hypothetical protein